ncbi:MAG: glycosyltransferase family 4 protein [Lachnospiraceae bacterium]|nr:glycosyltransferase family 4 protein [Lachnospiraceae bacterium]
MQTLLIVTNIPSPYRVDFFHYLQTNIKEYDIHIMFQSGNEKSYRTWSGGEEKLKNTHFLKSKVIKRTGFDQTEKYIPTGTAKVLDEVRPDTVVCMEYNPCAIMVKHWCNKNRVPYISWTDGTRLSEAHIGLLQKLSRKYIIKNTKAFIASSTAARDNQIYLGADPEKIHISYLTVDINRYTSTDTDKPKAEPFGIICVGSLIQRKGIDLLLNALGIIKDRDWTLTLAGEGPEKDALAKQAEELGISQKIRFAGFIEGEKLRDLYAESSLFILPTREDCFGLVTLEAMCAGLPVISSKYADGAYDLIEDGVTGFIVDPYDEKQFSETIETLMNNPVKAAEMGKAGLERSKEFSFEKVSKGFIEAVHAAPN